jgi:hypothetical protein
MRRDPADRPTVHAAVPGSLLLAALALASPLPAQDTLTFRYAPLVGTGARTITEVRTVTTFNGFPGLPDGSTLEEERRIEARHRSMGESNGLWLVESVIDTVWSRRRLDQGPWRDRVDSLPVRKPAVALVSSQFAVTGFRSSGPEDGEVFRPVGAMVAGLDFAFPGEPVAAGQTFSTGGRIHVRVRTTPESGLGVDETVFGDLSLTLDSIVRESGDELAYLRLGGGLTPRTTSLAGEAGSTAGTYTGAFVGRLVWSRRWNAFVSGVARVRVEGRVTAETGRGLVAATAVWDTTVRHQVRP